MRKLLTAVLLFFFIITGHAINIDSLIELSIVETDKSKKFTLLDEIAWQLRSTAPSKAINYSKASFQIAEELKNYEMQITSYNTQGALYHFMGKRDSSLLLFKKAYSINERFAKKLKLKGTQLMNIGAYFSNGKQIDSSLVYLSKAQVVFEELKDTSNLISTLVNLGYSYQESSQFGKANDTYFKALRLAEESNEKPFLKGKLYNNIGTVFNILEEVELGKKNFLLAKKAYEKAGNTAGLFVVNNNLSNILIKENKLDKAFLLLQENLKNNDLDNKSKAYTLNMLGNYYQEINELEKAKTHYKKAIDIKEKNKLIAESAKDLAVLAEVEYELGDYKSSKIHSNKAIKILNETNDKFHAKSAYITRIKSELQEKRLSNLMDKFNQFNTLSDSVFNNQMANAVIENEAKYQTEKKEQENLLLKKEKRNQQLKTYAAIALSLLIATIALLLFWQSRIRKKNNTQLQQKNQEILHRTKNNLTMLSVFMKQEARRLENEEAKAAVMEAENRLQTIAMIDQKLNQQNDQTININEYLSELMGNLKNTFSKNNENIQLKMGIDNLNLDAEHAAWIGLIVNELMTNSFKYAFAEKDNPQIEIALRRKINNQIDMTYRDNGIGLLKEVNIKNTKSFGQRLIRNLTEQMDGTIQTKNDNGLVYQFLFQTPKPIS